jgi:superfamily II DNA or RNA helicase
MQIDQKRLLEQQKIVQLWRDKLAKGTVIGPTGFGKSYVGILIIGYMNQKNPDRTTIIIVPTLELKNQWESHVAQHNLKNVTVTVINSAIKERKECDLIVLDEIHRYAANTFHLVFSMIKYKFILGLTATFDRSDMKHHILERFAPIVYKMTLREARKKDYVSEFEVYNLGIELNETDRKEYEDLDKKFNWYFAWFNHDFHKAQLVLKDRIYAAHFAHGLKMDPKDAQVKAINFFRIMQKRKQFIYHNRTKIEIVKQILEKYPFKAIVFSEITDFANEVVTMMGTSARALHSKIPAKKRNEILENFKKEDSDIRILSTSKMFDEGIDLPEISLAIITSGTSSKRQSLQRLGRVIRKKEGKKAFIFNIYIKDSQEYKWVDSRTSGMNAKWVSSLEDIDNEEGSDKPEQSRIWLV